MKFTSLTILIILCALDCQAQKSSIDINILNKWPVVCCPAISDDGRYVSYNVINQPAGSNTLITQSTKNSWKVEITGVNISSTITADSKRLIFSKKNDSLGIITLKKRVISYIPHVRSFHLIDKHRIAYISTDPENELVLHDLNTGISQSFRGVTAYLFSEDATTLLLSISTDSSTTQQLIIVHLQDGRQENIWKGNDPHNFVFSADGKSLAFMAGNTLWYYNTEIIKLVDNHEIEQGLQLDEVTAFSKSGDRLFIRLKEHGLPKTQTETVSVDVWSYKDAKLQSQQLEELAPQTYAAVINIADHHIIRLQRQDEYFHLFNNKRTDDWAFVNSIKGDPVEAYWNPAAIPTYYLVDTRNGERKQVAYPLINLSPEGRYILAIDTVPDYYCYDLQTGVIQNISNSVPLPTLDTTSDKPEQWRGELNHAIWLAGDAGVLVYDKYDIWQLDHTGRKPPVNLTGGYGRKNNIIFRIAAPHPEGTIKKDTPLLLSAFNITTKDNGFYRLRPDKDRIPVELTMGPYVYIISHNPVIDEFAPIKAKNVNKYIVRRCSVSQSNYFLTTDFKHFKTLSNVYVR